MALITLLIDPERVTYYNLRQRLRIAESILQTPSQWIWSTLHILSRGDGTESTWCHSALI
jgi:hypothetical protein